MENQTGIVRSREAQQAQTIRIRPQWHMTVLHVVYYLIMVVFLVFYMLPFWGTVMTSFKSNSEVMTTTPIMPPTQWTLEGYASAVEELGVPLKTERGRRVFPQSDRAEDVRRALVNYAQDARFEREEATGLILHEGTNAKGEPCPVCVGAETASGKRFLADAVLVATGGISYPATGSTGMGYTLAKQAGHTIVEPVPSLVSLYSSDAACRKMMGLSLKNVTLTLRQDAKPIFEEMGEMLFTHFGISGPLTLSASSHLGDMKKHKYKAVLDLKPALDEQQLYDRITRDFALLSNHSAQGALAKLLPASMQPVAVEKWGIDPATKANQITREQKQALVHLIKHWEIPITRRGDIEHAVITGGGVSIREVDPKTMQSKKCPGLYFAGEVLDVDAYTGGYNLQIAWCTAQAAARAWNR